MKLQEELAHYKQALEYYQSQSIISDKDKYAGTHCIGFVNYFPENHGIEFEWLETLYSDYLNSEAIGEKWYEDLTSIASSIEVLEKAIDIVKQKIQDEQAI